MALLKTRLRNTTLSMIAISILAMNIARSSKLHFISLIFIIKNYWENAKMKNIESMNYLQLYIVLKNA